MVTTLTKTDKKQSIIAAAIKLWQQAHNWNKVSLEDIAREASVSPTTVYNNFGTRERLVEEVIKHLVAEILDKQKGILKSGLPFPEKVQRMLSAKMKAINGMQADLLDKICIDTVVKKYIDEASEVKRKPLMAALIEEGKREGYIRPEVPVDVIMVYFDIIQTGSMSCIEEIKRVVSNKRLTTALVRLIYFGLFQKEFDLTLNNSSKEKSR